MYSIFLFKQFFSINLNIETILAYELQLFYDCY